MFARPKCGWWIAALFAGACATESAATRPAAGPPPDGRLSALQPRRGDDPEFAALVIEEQMILDLLRQMEQREDSARAAAMAECDLARVRFLGGDTSGAQSAIDRAADLAEKAGKSSLLQVVREQQLLVTRFSALELTKTGEAARAAEILGKLEQKPDLSPGQKSQLAADRATIQDLSSGSPAERETKLIAKFSLPSLPSDPTGAPAQPSGGPRGGDTPTAEKSAGISLDVFRKEISTRLGSDVAQSSLPDEEMLPAVETGRISTPAVNQVVLENKRAIRSCYEQELKSGRSLRGKLAIDVTVEPSGQVSGSEVATAKFKNTKFAECLCGKIAGWRFPPFAGEPATVVMNFVLNHSF